MPSRIVVGGRTTWTSHTFKKPAITRLPTKRDGTPIADFRVEPASADEPFRAGTSYYDAEEEIEYRVVRAELLSPAQGWGSSDFWCERWRTTFVQLKKLVSKGWLDAAIEEGTQVRRFRCRDEPRAVSYLDGEGAQEARKARRRRNPRSPAPL